MAESRVKLVIDSQEFDAKLKTASQNLQAYFDKVKEGGGSFEYLDDGVMDCAKALGELATKAKSTKGGISELTASFTEWSMRYKQMTDAEKNTPFGKQIRSSLDQLKARINDAKKDLADVNKELGDTGKESQSTGNIIDQLAGQFGMSTKALMGWGAALAAGKVALDVAKDAFFASEANIDDWGRTVESSKMLYEGFLNALNTGDISGYIQNMNSISQAAIKAYNELDRLGTMKTINAPSTSGRQTEITRLQGMLRSGRAVDSLTGGKSYAEDGAVLTKAQKQQVADDLKALLKESRDTAQQEIDQATSSINALYEEQATVLGMNTDEFRNGTKNMQEFDKVLEGAKKYREFEQQHTTTVQTTSGTVGATYTSSHRDNAVNTYEQFKAWSLFKDDGPMYQRLVQEIQKRDQATQQFYGLVNQSYRGINRAEGVRVGGTTTPQTNQQKATAKYEQAMSDYQQALEEAALAVKSGQADTVAAKKKELSAAESLWKAIGDAREVYDTDELKNAQEDAAKKVVELGGSVTALVEEQKKAQEAARKLTAAQEKAATSYQQMQTAKTGNDLKAYNTALKQYQSAQEDVQRLQASFPELPKQQGEKVVYTVEVNDEQLAKLKALPKDDETIRVNVEEGDVNLPLLQKNDQTIRFNVEQGDVDLPDIPKDDQTIRFNVEQGKVDLPQMPEKTYTVTIEAETEESKKKVDELVAGMNAQKVTIPVAVEQPKPVQVPVEMSYTDNNMAGFLASLKERIAQEDVGSELYRNLTAQLADANAIANLMQTAIKNGIDISQFNPQDLWSKVFGQTPGDYISDEQLEEIRKKIEEIIGKPIKLDVNTGNINGEGSGGSSSKETGSKYLSQISGGISSMTSSLEQLGIQVPEGLKAVLGGIQAVTSILTTISTIMSAIEAFSAAGSIPFFANGGIIPHAANGYFVPGTHYSGDTTPIMANAGELVLSRAQQSNLASTLSRRDESEYGGTPYVSGEQIFLGLNNYLKRSGRGELLTARS